MHQIFNDSAIIQKQKYIYTFIGFSDKNKINKAQQRISLKESAINQEIYSYSYEINTVYNSQSKNP